jgi:ribosomal protein S18 acetylase RimI-like enzyme
VRPNTDDIYLLNIQKESGRVHLKLVNNISSRTNMTFSIRTEETEGDREFIEGLNARLTEVIEAPAHSKSDVAMFQTNFTTTSWDSDIGENATFIAVKECGERIGYVNVREGMDEIAGEKCGYIALLAVIPEAEGLGVARSLVNEAEQWAKQLGYSRLALDVFASNDRGLRFYEKAGFQRETIRVIKQI